MSQNSEQQQNQSYQSYQQDLNSPQQTNGFKKQQQQSPRDQVFEQILQNASSIQKTIINKELGERNPFHHFDQKKRQQIRPFACSYQDCDWRFKTKHHLQRHLESHVKLKKFKCQYCQRQFGLQSFLQRHLKLFHRQQAQPTQKQKPKMKKKDKKQLLKAQTQNNTQIQDYYYRPYQQLPKKQRIMVHAEPNLSLRQPPQSLVAKYQFQLSQKDNHIILQNQKINEQATQIALLMEKNQQLNAEIWRLGKKSQNLQQKLKSELERSGKLNFQF